MAGPLYVVSQDSSKALGEAEVSLVQWRNQMLSNESEKNHAVRYVRHLRVLQASTGVDLLAITMADIQKFFRGKIAETSVQYQQQNFYAIKRFYKFALSRNFIEVDPAAFLRIAPITNRTGPFVLVVVLPIEELGEEAKSLELWRAHMLTVDTEKNHAARYLRQVRTLKEFSGTNLLEMTTLEIEKFFREKMANKSISFQQQTQASIKRFYRFAFSHGIVSSNPAYSLAPIHRVPLHVTRKLSMAEILSEEPAYIQEFHRFLIASGVGNVTIKVRLRHIRLLREYLDQDLLTASPADLEKFMAEYMEGKTAGYRKQMRGSFVIFFKFIARRKYIQEDPSAELPNVRQPRGLPRPVPDEYLQFAYAMSEDVARAAISLAAMAGLRLSEVTNAHMDDRDGNRLIVKGKGNRTRSVPLNEFVIADLKMLEAQQPHGYYFENPMTFKPRNPQWVANIITKHLPPGYTAHTLRHRAASVAYAQTKDLRAIQEFLGHADVSTTQIYTAVANAALTEVGASTAIGFSRAG